MSEEILINITPQGEAATAPSLARGPRLDPIGEAENPQMHLKCIRAAERPAMDEAEGSQVSGGHLRRRTGMPGMACPGSAREAGSEAPPGRAGDQPCPNVAPGMAGTNHKCCRT